MCTAMHEKLTTNDLNCGSKMGLVANTGKLTVPYTGKQGMKITLNKETIMKFITSLVCII